MHVPLRIAKGDLEGKMKCHIWRKLHPEEAKRFDQVYELIAKHPELSVQDAFGMLQSGRTLEEFLARKARAEKKVLVRTARSTVPNEGVEKFIDAQIEQKTELSVVLAERSIIDTLTGVEKVAFQLAKSGRLEKLKVVLLASRAVWEKLSPTLQRDARLTQKPMPVSRQPDRRPVSDPRIFQPLKGQRVRLVLRNGLILDEVLLEAGAFDLILRAPGEELLVPLHAIARYESA